MKYYFIKYIYEREIEITKWRDYTDTVLVEAASYDDAIGKILSSPIHKNDHFNGFVDLTIR